MEKESAKRYCSELSVMLDLRMTHGGHYVDLKQYIDQYGREEGKALAERAGTIWQYVYQCANGYRRPSVEKAKRLVEASGGKLDLLAMLTAPKKSKDQKTAA